MKKIKILAATLATSVVLMGAGYAGWTDNFKTENTIDTGKLEVVLMQCGANSETEVYEEFQEEEFKWSKFIENKYNIVVAEPEIDAIEKKATFEFNNLFPGTKSITYLYAKNRGTVPATIQNVNVNIKTISDIDESHDLDDAIQVIYCFKVKNNEVTKITGKCSLNDLKDNLNSNLNGLKGVCLDAENGVIYENFQFYIPKDSLNNDMGEKEKVTVSIDFDFVQGNLYNPQQ